MYVLVPRFLTAKYVMCMCAYIYSYVLLECLCYDIWWDMNMIGTEVVSRIPSQRVPRTLWQFHRNFAVTGEAKLDKDAIQKHSWKM